MRGSTHMIGGAAAAFTVMTLTGISEFQTLAVGAVFGALGGLIPDIDHPNSKIAHKTGFIGAAISKIFHHRGIWHTPVLYAVVWVVLQVCNGSSIWVNLLFAGIASHLLLDMLNPTGIPFLFPFTKRKIHLAMIRTGGKLEKAISFLLAISIPLLAVTKFQLF